MANNGPLVTELSVIAPEGVRRWRKVGDSYDRLALLADGTVLVGSGSAAPTQPAGTIVSGDSGWITPTLGAGWGDLGSGWQAARYRKLNGVVFVEGLILNSSGGGLTTTVFTLPAGYRPAANLVHASYGVGVQVSSAGAVAPNSSVVDTGIFGIFFSFAI